MICADASLAIKWLLGDEEHAERALALLEATLDRGDEIVAPPFLPVEITNILRQRMRRQGMSRARAGALLRHFLAIPITFTTPAGLYEAALTLADTYDLGAVYDAHYVAVAQAVGCDLWTADRRLVRALSPDLALVRWIGDYHAGATTP